MRVSGSACHRYGRCDYPGDGSCARDVVATDKRCCRHASEAADGRSCCASTSATRSANRRRNFMSFIISAWVILIAVSSVHGHGTGDLLDARVWRIFLPEEAGRRRGVRSKSVWRSSESRMWGKASLVNFLAGEERCIVSEYCRHHARCDRHGRSKTASAASLLWIRLAFAGKTRWRTALSATVCCAPRWRSSVPDVCVIMIDASVGFTEQDSKVAGLAHEAGKGCVIAVQQVGCRCKRRQNDAGIPQEAGNRFLVYALCSHRLYLCQRRGRELTGCLN